MYAPGLTSHFTAANFLTSNYRIVGNVITAHTGILGLLTARDTSVLEVHDALLARLDMPNRMADHYDVARLIKRQIVALCVETREDLGPLAQAGLSASDRYRIHLITPYFEIDGILEWSGRFDVTAILGQSMGEFIPLYEAALSAVLLPDVHIESPVMVINRQWIDLIALP